MGKACVSRWDDVPSVRFSLKRSKSYERNKHSSGNLPSKRFVETQ